jgi:hypothetical protein
MLAALTLTTRNRPIMAPNTTGDAMDLGPTVVA